MLKIIVAVTTNGVIGKDDDLPFNLPADRKWFKEKTVGHPVVMGRKTHEAILKRIGKPLPGREHIVLTRDALLKSGEATFVSWWADVLHRAKREDLFVIGGAEIFKLALPSAEELYITRVHADIDGDTFFPAWEESAWDLVSSTEHAKDEDNEYPFTCETYRRKSLSFIEPSNVRTDEQRGVMESILNARECPFCEENLNKYHKNPILREGQFWTVTENQWPYPGSQLHLLVILRSHMEEVSELPPDSLKELLQHLDWAVKLYKLPGGALAMRFGEPIFSGATVRHLHVHIVSPKEDADSPLFISVGGNSRSQ